MCIRDRIKALPNRLIGIIFGIILIVNSDPVSKAAPEDIEELVKTNMLLFGGVIVFLSFLRTMIDYWLKISYPENKENPPLPSERE